jgi:hypothetical protein
MQESIAELFGPHVAESELANSEVEIASAEHDAPARVLDRAWGCFAARVRLAQSAPRPGHSGPKLKVIRVSANGRTMHSLSFVPRFPTTMLVISRTGLLPENRHCPQAKLCSTRLQGHHLKTPFFGKSDNGEARTDHGWRRIHRLPRN